MNRPKLEQYWDDGTFDHTYDYKELLDELKKYCNEFTHRWVSNECDLTCLDEDDLKLIKMQYTTLQLANDVYRNVIKDFEQVIDRACEELELSNKQLRALDKSFLPMSKEDWKQYLMKGISDE